MLVSLPCTYCTIVVHSCCTRPICVIFTMHMQQQPLHCAVNCSNPVIDGFVLHPEHIVP
jgi:hypothetical protein